jgi:hypothetical protein
LAAAPSSLTPLTLNLVPARSQLNLIESKILRKEKNDRYFIYLDINHKSIPSFL